jgi:hypothetical protein
MCPLFKTQDGFINVLLIVLQSAPTVQNTAVTRSFQNVLHSSTVTRCLTSLPLIKVKEAYATLLSRKATGPEKPSWMVLVYPGVPPSSSPWDVAGSGVPLRWSFPGWLELGWLSCGPGRVVVIFGLLPGIRGIFQAVVVGLHPVTGHLQMLTGEWWISCSPSTSCTT